MESEGRVDDRELLWDAYPDGYLAMRGVRTLAGYQCVGVTGAESLWLPTISQGRDLLVGLPSGGPPYEKRSCYRDGMNMFRAAADVGDFLPAVSIYDTATWACLLLDLATAAELTEPPPKPSLSGLPFRQISWTKDFNGIWYLYARTHHTADSSNQVLMYSFHIPTSDPAFALVLARIRIRRVTNETPMIESRHNDHDGDT